MIDDLIGQYNIPIVKQNGSIKDPVGFLRDVSAMTGIEGFVVRWLDGFRVKIKTEQYILLHKMRESLLQDRNIVELLIENKLDDVKPYLTIGEREKLLVFETCFHGCLNDVAERIRQILQENPTDDRKTFALDIANKQDICTKAILFKCFGQHDNAELPIIIKSNMYQLIKLHLAKTTRYLEVKQAWFPNCTHNDN